MRHRYPGYLVANENTLDFHDNLLSRKGRLSVRLYRRPLSDPEATFNFP